MNISNSRTYTRMTNCTIATNLSCGLFSIKFMNLLTNNLPFWGHFGLQHTNNSAHLSKHWNLINNTFCINTNTYNSLEKYYFTLKMQQLLILTNIQFYVGCDGRILFLWTVAVVSFMTIPGHFPLNSRTRCWHCYNTVPSWKASIHLLGKWNTVRKLLIRE